MRFGPPRYYQPIAVKREFGFIGGPSMYRETIRPESGVLIVDAEDVPKMIHAQLVAGSSAPAPDSLSAVWCGLIHRQPVERQMEIE